ncbi:YadA-like family protein [Histophilus somni]|uniref:YadA-like family protein n=1 Tax=Histophilus somni TaxID=731 RepID=UPI00201EC6A8|nr:YadA-like family protein [Histophilus somni]
MNKIFKTKYDVTTGQTKVVSELATNRQIASSSESKPKCSGFFGGNLGAFKLAPLALALMTGMFSSIGYSEWIWIENNKTDKGMAQGEGGLNEGSTIAYNSGSYNSDERFKNETLILSSHINKTGANTSYTNKDFARTVVLGSRTVGGGNETTAIGYKAIVGKNEGGDNIKNESHQGTAVGFRTFAYGEEAVSLGNDTVAYGKSSISIGSDNVGSSKYTKKALSYDIWELFHDNGAKFNNTAEYSATSQYSNLLNKPKNELYTNYLGINDSNKKSYAYKTHNWAYGDSSIAIGSRNVAFGNSSLALGTLSVAKGDYSTALGTGTLAFGNSSVAIGNESYVYKANSIGVGNEVQAISDGSMVYGYQSYAGGPGSIAIGKRALSNVAPSEHFKQTVEAFGDLWYEGKSNVDALGKLDNPKNHGKDKTLDDYFLPATATQQGTEEEKATSQNTGAVAIGYYVYALGENSVALGRQAYSKGNRSIAIGPYAYGGYEKTIAMGYGAKAMNKQSLALGSLSRVEGENSVALGVAAKVLNDANNSELNGQNSMALGNNSEVTMKNSVAIGNMSNTRYYYTGDKSNPTPSSSKNQNNDNSAITLSAYIPKGTSYSYTSTSDDGVISVGGWDRRDGKLGRRRIINVAPGALDSDAATVGQLKALEYAYKEGVVAYYTVEDGKNYKVVKHTDGKFYKANTENGTPLDTTAITADKVFVGPKGANETSQTIQVNGGRRKNVVDMGEKIKFAHILDGEIKDNSDHAITGNQLKNVGDILGISINSNNTKFDNPSFTKVKYNGARGKDNHTTFKSAIDESIIAINKGLTFKAGKATETKQLGDTLEFIGDSYITATISDSDKKIKYSVQATTTLDGTQKLITSKAVKDYVDPKFTHYVSIKGTGSSDGNYDNKGAKGANSVAIGVDAGTESAANAGIAIGYNAQSKAKNAVVIGTNVSIDVPNSFVLGSDNKVTQTGGQDKTERAAVVVIGSGTTLTESKSAIAIGAVNADGGTEIENAAWTASIGNKNKIKKGTDIVALGNNIKIEADNSDSAKVNTEVIAIGNAANAKKASGSILIGAKTKAESNATQAVIIGYSAKAGTNASQTVVIGKSAESSAAGAVAIGEGAIASVANSVAIGKGSKTTGNTSVNGYDPSTKTAYVGSGNANTWKPNSGVFSVGDGSNTTRRITGVAAGSADTDAVNVAQLKKVVSGAATLKYKANGSNEQSIDLTTKGLNFTNGTYTEATVGANGMVKFDINQTAKGKIDGALQKTEANTQYAKIDGSNITNKVSDWRDKLDVYTKGDTDSKINAAKTALTEQINKKVDTDTFNTAKSELETKISGKADKSLSDINNAGRKVIKDLITVEGSDKIEVTTANDDNTSNAKKFTVKLNNETKNKINSIGTGEVVDGNNNTVTGGKVYTAIEGAKTALNDAINKKVNQTTFDTATFGLKGNDGNAVTTTLNSVIEIKGSETTETNKKNIYVSKSTGTNNGLEIKLGDTLSGISSIGKDDKAKISFNTDNAKNEITYTVGNTTETATYKFGTDGLDLGSKKITGVASGIGDVGSTTTNLDKVLTGTPDGTYKSNAANVEDLAKVADAIIKKGLEFEDGNGGKVNRKLGEALKIVGETAANTGSPTTTITTAPGNIKVTAKKSDTNGNANDTLEIGLSKDLTGIESITKGANKAKLTLGENTASLESATNKSKIELKDNEIDLTTSTGKTVKVKDNALEGVNKINAESGTNTNSIDLANGTNKKNVVITADGKQLAIAKDGTTGKDGISLTGLTDRKVDETGYGTSGNAGRAATEAAVLDLKTKGLTFEVNEKNTDSNPKTLKRELGETLKITGTEAVIENFDKTYSLDNIATKIDENNKAIRIGLLKTPRFDALELGKDETKKISLTPDFTNGNELKLALTGTGAGTNTKVKISGVANGTDDNDAINKSQLNSVVTALGGSATIGADGTITQPTYTLENGKTTGNNKGEYKNIGEALKALDTALTKNNTSASSLGEASITLSDGKNEFTRKNSDTDKQVIIKGENNVNVALSIDDTKNKGTFTVSLNKQLKGIESIENDDKTKITLNGDKSIKFSSGDKPETVTLTGSKLSGLTEVSKESDKATIKFNDNSIELSPEKDVKITLAKDNTKSTVKATGLSTIGNDDNNALVFNTGDTDKTTANLKVGGKDLTLTKVNEGIKLSGLSDGEILLSSTEAITGKQLNELGLTYLGLKVDDTDKSKFKAPSFTAVKGVSSSKTPTTFKSAIDDLTTAINNGLTFKGTDSSKTTTIQLGATLTINGEDTKAGKESDKDKTEKDINVEVTPNDTNPKDPKDAGTITLKLNKSDSVNENDERVVTSKAVYTKYKELDDKITDTKIKYRANSSKEKEKIKEVKLSEGLDFLKDDNSNISVTVEDDGKIKHSLANNLTSISSISGGKNADDKAAKITLSDGKTDEKSITLNDAKLTGILDGKIESSSKDAISGNQLNDLATKLGIAINENNKTKFDDPSFEAVKNGADTTTADSSITDNKIKTHKEAIEKLIEAVNKGYKYSADENDKVNTDKMHYLGSTININRLADSTTTSGTTPTITMSEFTGKNLVTQYKYEGGNAKIEIGFKDSPIFKSVSLSEEQKYDSSKSLSENEKKELITKDYLEQALNSFKIKVKANGKDEISLGRGDTLNLENGLNIEVGLKKGSADSNNSATTSTTSTTSTTTQPASTTTTTPTTALATIGTTKELTGLTSIETETENGESSLLDSYGLIVGDDNNVTTLSKDGVLIEKEDKSTNEQTAESNTLTNKESQTVVKAGEISINDSTGANKVRIDDKSITFAENSGKITGLADIVEDEKDGSIAVNKNYVDSKIKEVTAGQPFEYATIKDNAKVVRGVDGKLYKEADLNKYYYDEKTASYKPRDPKNSSMTELKALNNDEVIVNLMPKGDDKSPIAIGNVKSILGAEASTNQDKAAKAIEELIKENGTLSTKKDNVATGSDMAALAKAGLNFGVSTGEDIHRNLGEKISIVGRDLKAEILKEMNISNGKVDDDKKAEYEAKLAVAKKAIADGFSTKNVVTIANQNSVVINIADKPEFKAISIKDDQEAPGSTLDLNPNAISMTDEENNAVMDAGGMVVTDNNGSTEVNANNISLTDSEDKESNLEAGKLVLSHQDKELVVEVGEKGGKITGLEVRHPTDSDYGTDTTRAATESAVKKNRDDVEDGVIGPMVYTDNKGNRLVKVEGKYYLVSDVENGKAKEKANAVANPALSLVNADRNGGDTKVPVVLNNVAAGELSENSRQAVNGAQLHQTNVHVQNNSLRINNLQNQVNILNKDMRAGVAQAVAQANLPINILPGKSTLSLATGNYMGTQAFAVGYSRVSDNGKLSVKFSLGHGDKKTSVGAGIGYSW